MTENKIRPRLPLVCFLVGPERRPAVMQTIFQGCKPYANVLSATLWVSDGDLNKFVTWLETNRSARPDAIISVETASAIATATLRNDATPAQLSSLLRGLNGVTASSEARRVRGSNARALNNVNWLITQSVDLLVEYYKYLDVADTDRLRQAIIRQVHYHNENSRPLIASPCDCGDDTKIKNINDALKRRRKVWVCVEHGILAGPARLGPAVGRPLSSSMPVDPHIRLDLVPYRHPSLVGQEVHLKVPCGMDEEGVLERIAPSVSRSAFDDDVDAPPDIVIYPNRLVMSRNGKSVTIVSHIRIDNTTIRPYRLAVERDEPELELYNSRLGARGDRALGSSTVLTAIERRLIHYVPDVVRLGLPAGHPFHLPDVSRRAPWGTAEQAEVGHWGTLLRWLAWGAQQALGHFMAPRTLEDCWRDGLRHSPGSTRAELPLACTILELREVPGEDPLVVFLQAHFDAALELPSNRGFYALLWGIASTLALRWAVADDIIDRLSTVLSGWNGGGDYLAWLYEVAPRRGVRDLPGAERDSGFGPGTRPFTFLVRYLNATVVPRPTGDSETTLSEPDRYVATALNKVRLGARDRSRLVRALDELIGSAAPEKEVLKRAMSLRCALREVPPAQVPQGAFLAAASVVQDRLCATLARVTADAAGGDVDSPGLPLNLIQADLSGVSLPDGFSVADADLRSSQMAGILAPNINLRRANLVGASLRGARLVGADLSSADLTGADLTDACLKDAKLAGANLQGCKMLRADIRGADLSTATVDGPDALDDVVARWAGVRVDARTRAPMQPGPTANFLHRLVARRHRG